MHLHPAVVVSVVLGLLIVTRSADARPVILEARTAAGQSLGQIVGDLEDRVVYVPLQEVAELVRGAVRRSPRGDRATLVARKRAVEVRRGSAVVFIRGRALALSAPVRQRQGEWLVPADLL
ncbi:MAG: stalk domain-containing protein, partial [Candidatus Rokuibacteriota bacterium]